MTPNPGRSVEDIDKDLANAVKRRLWAQHKIPQMQQGIVNDTRIIDRLLAERNAVALPTSEVPESPEGIDDLPSLGV